MMKKVISLMLVCFVLMGTMLCFASCSIDEDDIEGTWTSDVFTSSGKSRVIVLSFDDGKVYKFVYQGSNATLVSADTGTYEIEGKEIVVSFKGDGAGVKTRYKYKNGELVNGDRTYTKD